MTLTKKITAGLFAAIAVIGMTAGTAFAQTDTVDLRAQIVELKEEHKEMRALVQSGELTKEEAMDLWKEKVAEMRNLKDQIFEARQDKVEKRYEKMLEKNPERAEALQSFMDSMTERRAALQTEREALHDAVQNGDITRDEAREQRREMYQTAHEERAGFRSDFKAKRLEMRDGIRAERVERQAARPISLLE